MGPSMVHSIHQRNYSLKKGMEIASDDQGEQVVTKHSLGATLVSHTADGYSQMRSHWKEPEFIYENCTREQVQS